MLFIKNALLILPHAECERWKVCCW